MRTRVFVLVLLALSLPGYCAQAAIPREAGAFEEWGSKTLARIRRSLYLGNAGFYAEDRDLAKPAPERPAFLWGAGVQLSALAAAARVRPSEYLAQARAYADALDAYWITAGGIGGYDVLPHASSPDRYYDDNAWVVLDLLEMYRLTHHKKYLSRAERAMAFVLSGQDASCGGGIYWHEQKHTYKAACSNAPVIVGLLSLYQVTHTPEYLARARRLYQWINTTLQDRDGLYFDGIRVDGSLEKRKWSYNSALMIRANCLFYAVTRDAGYLKEAERIAKAAETQWVRADTGAIDDDAAFAHLLCGAFVDLYRAGHDARWLDVAARAAEFVWRSVQAPNGYFGHNWATTYSHRLLKITLLDQASAARAFWTLAALAKDLRTAFCSPGRPHSVAVAPAEVR
ncbi:MAG: glycoside hydrolase family 76 protein [Chthonomonadales bacterium]